MASAHFQTLLRPPDIHESEARSLDLLNTGFKSLKELEDEVDLDDTVEQAVKDIKELKAKLARSQHQVDALITQSWISAKDRLDTAQDLSLLRHSYADELHSLSLSMVSSSTSTEVQATLLEDLEASHRHLKELESVKGYVQVIEHTLRGSNAAVKQVEASPSLTSVTEYEALQRFVKSAHVACASAEQVAGDQKLHILAFLETIRDQTWLDIRRVLSSTLLVVAEKLHWPSPIDYVSTAPTDREAFESAFLNLLKLQTIGKQIHASSDEFSEKAGLYPLQALVQPISLRFKYHFEGTRQTNRLDKPEWYFTHILNTSHEHRAFMDNAIQTLLTNTDYREMNAWREFTYLLFSLLERKLKRTVPSLLAHPPVLAHTIYQALAFDSTLREEGFGIRGTSASKQHLSSACAAIENGKNVEWLGISEVILGRKEWFEAWLEGERKFAMDQYMEIIAASDAWLVADDDNDNDNDDSSTTIRQELKPTNSARRVKALVEQITDRYSPLPQFGHRTRFLITVQLPIMESYLSRISASLDAFETLSSTFMRAVPGALGSVGGDGSGRTRDTSGLTSGVEGVQRLYKAYISAKYMGMALEGWGEDLFFLELWTEINRRASLRSRVQITASLPSLDDDGHLAEGTIFEELVTQYGKLATRAEDMIVYCISGEVEGDLKPHFASLSPTLITPSPNQGSGDDIAVSPALLGPLSLLSTHLSFLQSALPRATLLALYRRIASRLSTHILQRQIFYRGRGRIGAPEGRAILAECELWVETCRLALALACGERARAEGPWLQLLQACRLVAADGAAFRKAVAATLGTAGDREWEDAMLETVGVSHLSREEVSQILRTRADCEQ